MRKKSIATLIVLSICLTGCAAENKNYNRNDSNIKTTLETEIVTEPAVNSEQPEPSEQTEEVQQKANFPKITIVKEETTYESTDQKYHVLYYCVESALIEEKEHPELSNGISEYFKENQESLKRIADEYAVESEEIQKDLDEYEREGYLYTLTQEISQYRSDDKVLSLELNRFDFRGGAHGSYMFNGATFDTKTGKELLLTDIIKDQEGFKKTAVDYIIKSVETSVGEELFPEYKETIESTLENVQWVLSDYGLKIYYQEYEIAPYTAGVITVELPYSFIQEYMNTAYIPEEAEPKLIRLSQNQSYMLDFGKGEQEVVVENEMQQEDYYLSCVKLIMDGKEVFVYFIEEPGPYYSGECYYFKNTDGKKYLLVKYTGDSDYSIMCAYQLKYSEFVETDSINGYLNEENLNAQELEMLHKVDVFGSYTGAKHYKISYNGKMVTEDKEYRLVNPIGTEFERALTLKQNIRVYIEGKETNLKSGRKIYPVALSDEKLYFESEEGKGYIEYENGEGGVVLVEGEEENEVFDGIQYAG